MLPLEDYMLPCLSKKLFGFNCLGCGLQRSVSFLLQGDFIAAFKMYPAIYTLIPLFLIIGVTTFYKIKNANIIINILAILSILIILINYFVKLIY